MKWFPLSPRLRRALLSCVLAMVIGVLTVLIAVAFHWPEFCEQYGPMRQNDSQCLICGRERVEKWVRGEQLLDKISTNEFSNWVDSFEPTDHEHVWLVSTRSGRSGWFDSSYIGCGGSPVISTIYSKRSEIGEMTAQRLIAEFHKLVRSPNFEKELGPLDRFLDAAMNDPVSLLPVDDFPVDD